MYGDESMTVEVVEWCLLGLVSVLLEAGFSVSDGFARWDILVCLVLS